MKHTDLSASPCPIAQGLNHVGEWWSILIMRDALMGLTRFDEFLKSLGIAPNILTRRLNDLVESGMLSKALYCEKPPRYEYILTDTGRDFDSVIMAFVAWGNRHFTQGKHSTDIVDLETQQTVRLGLVDLNTGEPIHRHRHCMAAGPAASERMRYRFDYAAKKRDRPGVDMKFELPPRSAGKGEE